MGKLTFADGTPLDFERMYDAAVRDLREAEDQRDALLEACEAALDQLIETHPHWEPDNECRVMRQIRAAIAKAKGENDA